MTLDVIDPLGWVRRNQALFFPGGKVDAICLLAYVMADVLELGGGECRIAQRDGWWFVTSDVDWLEHELPVEDLFQRVVVAPQHGEHSMRAEVLVAAYAADVLAVSGGVATVVKGQPPDDSLVERARGMIAFRLPT